MGSRLGVIVLTDAGPELYYDHWAAQTIGIDIAIDGFEATLARVRTMEPMGVRTPAEWRGATWIEGSLLIDVTRRRVAWAEESDYLYLPRIINHLIEATWPGWSALWSPEGVRGILWLAGVDPSTLFTPQDCSLPAVNSLNWFVPWGDNNSEDAISVCLDDTRMIVWRGAAFLDNIAEFGPDAILSAAEETSRRAAAGEPLAWELQVRKHRPDTGIHIDFRQKSVRWWALGDNDNQIDAFDALWRDWSVETVGDSYEFHERTTGKPMRDWTTEINTVRDIVERSVAEGPRTNPVERLATLMAERGEQVTFSSAVLQFRPSSNFGGARRAISALDALAAAPPLPPARIVNRHGDVIDSPD